MGSEKNFFIFKIFLSFGKRKFMDLGSSLLDDFSKEGGRYIKCVLRNLNVYNINYPKESKLRDSSDNLKV
jgi:hypothetical protein